MSLCDLKNFCKKIILKDEERTIINDNVTSVRIVGPEKQRHYTNNFIERNCYK